MVDGAGIISTVAGNGEGKFAGDGGPAPEASLYKPWGLEFGPDGSLYIADSWNNRVRKIDPQGTITTVAGNGEREYAGDGGPGVEAALYNPRAVAVAADGTVYIADRENQRIRKVDPAGIITTFAGNGEPKYAGDGGPAVEASIWNPLDVAVGPDGSVYINESNNRRIRKVDPAGVITTLAGNGDGGYTGDGGPATEAALGDPQGVFAAADGRIYIADRPNGRVRMVDRTGIIATVAGTGPHGPCGDGGRAIAACLRGPRAIATGPDGSLYIADRGNHRVAKIDPSGIITSVLGDGTPERPCERDTWYIQEDCQNSPHGVAAGPDGSVYIAHYAGHRVHQVDPAGVVTVIAGNGEAGYSGDGGPATEARLHYPRGLAVSADGALYIADMGNNCIRKVGPGGIITTFAGNGWTDDWGVGRFSGDGRLATRASLNRPVGLAVSADGSLYIADSWNHRIRRVDDEGIITTVAGTGQRGFFGDGGRATKARLSYPTGLAMGADGSVYVADPGNIRIRRVDRNGIISSVAGGGFPTAGIGDGGPAAHAVLRGPRDVAVSADGSLYIADTDNHRIRKVCGQAANPPAR